MAASHSVKETTTANGKVEHLSSLTRQQRNLAEKHRRDKVNGYIGELATIVPMIARTSRRLDKVSVLRLTAAYLRLHFSCLNPKNFKKRSWVLPENFHTDLDVLQQVIGGFLMVTTFSGKIIFASITSESYLGHKDIDMMGHSVFSFIHDDDIEEAQKQLKTLINSSKMSDSKSGRCCFKARMRERCRSRSQKVSYREMMFFCTLKLNDAALDINGDQRPIGYKKHRVAGPEFDSDVSSLLQMFIEPVAVSPKTEVKFIDAFRDLYITTHGLKGEILYADHRISAITGHFPSEVCGMSAYAYIYSGDVPVAQFAQKLMFSSDSGTGMIVYRLRTRNNRLVYLQSSGHLEYDKASSKVSHFVCFNKLLSDEEGSQDLKKFQDYFMPCLKELKDANHSPSPADAKAILFNAPGYERYEDQPSHFDDISDSLSDLLSPSPPHSDPAEEPKCGRKRKFEELSSPSAEPRSKNNCPEDLDFFDAFLGGTFDVPPAERWSEYAL